MLHDYLTSQIRTLVPIGVGALISYLSLKGVELDGETQELLTIGGTALTTSLYYAAARGIEMKWPKAGRWLLGSQRKPQYQGSDLSGAAGISPALADGDSDK